MKATPLIPSDALKVTVTAETYQPLFPTVPETAAEDTGAVVSIDTVIECTGSEIPARSVAWNSTTCCPSPTMNGAAYTDQGPPSIRYEMFTTPLVASFAAKDTERGDTNQPLFPAVPDSAVLVVGGTVSTAISRDCVGSTSPARSVARYSTRCSPSVTRNGPEYVVQAPPSTRYDRSATPLVASVAA